ncbi:hypothetical protein E1B28_001067 [Marasmius oreades]|uniref:Uncharacterized protein n=1 Tax=Marasmius oreades TaxID=181124 RepID=A0A9P7V2Q4_9AGAR|nr:uncharacterized protein E1B28_001067 [Marasmius oreades]KAG7099200.1 hypothetical protein E1B28_001067 [Marasmius oreades]
MAQPTARSSALTISAGPDSVFIADFDAMVENWDRHLNLLAPEPMDVDPGDQEFDPHSQQPMQKRVGRQDTQQAEDVRAEACTLKEHHDHLLSVSFDRSFQGISDGIDPFSSQFEPAIQLDTNFFESSDGLGLDGGLADELARELGEGWGGPFIEESQQNMDVDLNPLQVPSDHLGLGLTGGDEFMLPALPEADHPRPSQPLNTRTPSKTDPRLLEENGTPRSRSRCASSRAASVVLPSPSNSFSRMLLSQGEDVRSHQQTPFADITTRVVNEEKEKRSALPRKNKRIRVLLDARTELTDEELKIARAKYVQEQRNQRRELDHKKIKKDSGKVVEELVWGVPTGIEAPSLIDFWQENFKVQVEARTGALHIHIDDPESTRPPNKRRKLQTIDEAPEGTPLPIETVVQNDTFFYGAGDIGFLPDDPFSGNNVDIDVELPVLRSSEEPGQARNISRQRSVGLDLSFNLDSNEKLGSQKSSLFPWDGAGADISSSVGGAGGGSDRVAFERADVKLRESPLSRRECSLPLSQNGNISVTRGASPGDFGKNSQIIGEDFVLRGKRLCIRFT